MTLFVTVVRYTIGICWQTIWKIAKILLVFFVEDYSKIWN